jgi:hypothetical protein
VVRGQLASDLVTLHLALSLVVAGLLVATLVLARIGRPTGYIAEPSWLALVCGAAAFVFAVIMLGSALHDLFFPGWPLMFEALVPGFDSRPVIVHFAHGLGAALHSVAAAAGVIRIGRVHEAAPARASMS